MPKAQPPFCSKCGESKLGQSFANLWTKMKEFDSRGVDIVDKGDGPPWISGHAMALTHSLLIPLPSLSESVLPKLVGSSTSFSHRWQVSVRAPKRELLASQRGEARKRRACLAQCSAGSSCSNTGDCSVASDNESGIRARSTRQRAIQRALSETRSLAGKKEAF